MKVMTGIAIVVIGAALFEAPTIRNAVVNEVREAVGPSISVAAPDQATFDRVCPLLDVYFKVDGAGQGATRKAITALAASASKTTQDPAVKAFLDTVPLALADGKSAQSKAAKALVSRECSAHGASISGS
jgi:hypothetical protein